MRLFSPDGAPDAYYAGFGLEPARAFAPPSPTRSGRASGTRLTPTTPVTLSWNNGQGQIFQIVLTVDANYLFTAEQRLLNRGGTPIAARAYGLIKRVGESHDPSTWANHIGPVGVFNGNADYGYNFSNVAEAGTVGFSSHGGWLGFTDKYWLAAVVPDQNSDVQASFRFDRPTNAYQADFWTPPGDRRARPRSGQPVARLRRRARRSTCSKIIRRRSAPRSSARSIGAGSAGS